ncbi:MAG: peptidoglycan DD-metalloendopeptidase family protein [Butyrivibrio sp.]
MEKFTGEEVEYSSKRKSKSFLIVVVACIVMAVICSVVFICTGGINPRISTDNENTTGTTASEDTSMDTRVDYHNPDPDSPNFTKDSILAWPVKGEILMGFCTGETVYHKTQDLYKISEGIMIQADMGTPVYCGADGTVIEVGDDEEYGAYVKTNLGNGYTLYYYQLKDIPINSGDVLKKGTVIGYINEPTEYYTLEGSHYIVILGGANLAFLHI